MSNWILTPAVIAFVIFVLPAFMMLLTSAIGWLVCYVEWIAKHLEKIGPT